ncbi:phosphoglycerate dehydrogenase [Algiphilus sp.]|uniref:phosphoglycerate dehydrogenase n=1 Tax=Algiphilus sp. TaxID=1872431 RepID=UPI001CA6F808|nr:phosphoglycerate dehydrogenase [Algiphilus sp.]MBY8965092.1 phosphoglycerate dehydrogenase [Algiphilus acroporae]MCI5104245.1 phosphoglycerate dehydrogenase [Algiphilus sp.]MCR9090475.1 phosphoglycerate dehydrogenase [Pseudomonadota bacterium]
MYRIQTLNNISPRGLEHLPRERYEVASEINDPDAILVRSFKMHDMDIPKTVRAIGRAGAGTNNIPVDVMSERGVPVFNAPGANANAVKELVIAGMLMAARNIAPAIRFVDSVDADDSKVIEDGKKKFAGFELPGRSLGIVGLGAIGVRVANSAHDLGMEVTGFDPKISVDNAWRLSAGVNQATTVDELCAKSQFLTVHVPLIDATKGLISAERIRSMPKDSVILNFARGGIVDEDAVLEALDSGHLHAYVCDFPSNKLKAHAKVIALPHLGASTGEAEENCAIMVARQIRDFLENGNVTNSVNFPESVLPRVENEPRLCIANANVPNMVGQMTSLLAKHNLNITDMLNKSRGNVAYTMVDVDSEIPQSVADELMGIEGVLSVRLLPAA